MPALEIVQILPQPGPDEHAAILAALRQLAASRGVAGTGHTAAAPLRYRDATREPVVERPPSWRAAARLAALHV